MVWRLLKIETHRSFINMAIDEAIMQARIADLVPDTLRLYKWRPSAVSIGRFQTLESEVQVGNCRKYGVDVVRRITGGGAVYHDTEGEITYSVVASKAGLHTSDIGSIYAKLYDGLAQAVRTKGVIADFSEGNLRNCPNLTVNGKKISGSAQSHKSGVVLQHGTVLIEVDLEKMFTFLRVPWAETCYKVADIAKNKITCLKKELNRDVSTKEVCAALTEGFSKALNVEFVQSGLIPFERELAEKLCNHKYSVGEWNLKGTAQLSESG